MAGDADKPENVSSAPSARLWLELADAELLAQCQVDTYRASGPGGQKRNKTSSAVRLRHGPTETLVTASESRSQHENRARALRRLREAIALEQRTAIDPQAPLPGFLADALKRMPGLHVNHRHPDYCRIIQFVLDLLAVRSVSVSEAAERLGLSTGQLVRFFKADSKLWARVNRMRQASGRRPLS